MRLVLNVVILLILLFLPYILKIAANTVVSNAVTVEIIGNTTPTILKKMMNKYQLSIYLQYCWLSAINEQ